MFGDAEKLTIGAKSTQKGILVHVRDFSDLPVLIDESSDAGDNLSDIVYTLTSNKGRVKSTVTGSRDGGEVYRTRSQIVPFHKFIRSLHHQVHSICEFRVDSMDKQTKKILSMTLNYIY